MYICKSVKIYVHTLKNDLFGYFKNENNKTKPMKVSDLNELTTWWGNSEDNYKSRKENTHAWKVSLEEIKSYDYNLDCKNPHKAEEEIYDPELLISEYAEIKKDIDSLSNNLKKILSDAFKTSNSKD